MKQRLLNLLDSYLGHLIAGSAAVLYLALLAGVPRPIQLLLGAVLASLALRWLQQRVDLWARLRTDAPLLLLGGLFLLALSLRWFGSPEAVPAPDSDEAHFVSAALEIIRSGSYLPALLRHPPLLVYVELAASLLRFLAGASRNLWTWPTELLPEHLYGWGRAAVMWIGAASVLPLYWIGRRLAGRRTGLLAALFLGLLPLHLTASGIVTPEVPAALLALLATCFSLQLLQDRRSFWAMGAGMWAGLATATHYPAGLALIAPLLALFLSPVAAEYNRAPESQPMHRSALALLVLTGALLGFVAACPAVLFAPDRLAAGLAEAARSYFPSAGQAGSGLRYLLTEGLGLGPSLLVAVGLLFWLPRLRRRGIVLFCFPLLVYAALLLPRARFPRDLVLLAPWMALLAAGGVERVIVWAEGRWPHLGRWIGWGLALLSGLLFALALC